jgi:hypothetical protein
MILLAMATRPAAWGNALLVHGQGKDGGLMLTAKSMKLAAGFLCRELIITGFLHTRSGFDHVDSPLSGPGVRPPDRFRSQTMYPQLARPCPHSGLNNRSRLCLFRASFWISSCSPEGVDK